MVYLSPTHSLTYPLTHLLTHSGIISSPVVNLVTQYIEQHLDSNDELMSNSIDLLSSLCEATLLGPNISVVFSLHVVLPFINRIIESSKSHVSRLSMVYRILSVTVIHLTPSIVAGEVVPLWTQFMLLLGAFARILTHTLTLPLTPSF